MKLIKLICILGFILSSSYLHANIIDHVTSVEVSNPILHYKFVKQQGSTTTLDSTGNNNGTYVGNVVLDPGSGKVGDAAHFDGNSYIDVSALGVFNQLTVEMWINLSEVKVGCCTSLYSTDLWNTDQLVGSSLHINIFDDSLWHAANLNGTHSSNQSIIKVNTWHHIVTTFDASNGISQIFIDGSLDASSTLNTNPIYLSDSQIGSWNGVRGLVGLIDEFAIYDTVLTSEQINLNFLAANLITEKIDDVKVSNVKVSFGLGSLALFCLGFRNRKSMFLKA